ncbi:hypothetical protein HYDPIDRAFT_171678, partial [Hydnomerulius pinastri MD-312]
SQNKSDTEGEGDRGGEGEQHGGAKTGGDRAGEGVQPNEIATLHNEEIREKVICEKEFRSGLLIDSIMQPFLNKILGQVPGTAWAQYSLCPNGQLHRDKVLTDTALKHWVTVNNESDAVALTMLKIGQVTEPNIVTDDFIPYFDCLKPVVSKLYSVIHNSQNSSNQLMHQAVRDILLEGFVMIEEDKSWGPFKDTLGYRLLQLHVGSKCKLPSYATVGYEEDNYWNVYPSSYVLHEILDFMALHMCFLKYFQKWTIRLKAPPTKIVIDTADASQRHQGQC